MVKIEASTTVDRPVDEVWKFVTDLSNSPKWHIEGDSEWFAEMKQTSTGPLGVGTTFLYRRSKYPKITDGRVVVYEPNRKVSFEFTSGAMKGATVIMSFEVIEGKTRVIETDDYKLSGFWKLVGLFMGGGMKRNAEARVVKLKHTLESGSKS
jgi:uncharacterized protein YndB with AHSA1/START domain